VPPHAHRRSPVGRSRCANPVDPRPPEAQALARAILLAKVLRWREEWRAAMAAKVNGHATAPARRPRSADGDAAKFAASVARAELGRFYWDGRVATLTEDGPAEKKKPKGKSKRQ